MEDFIWQWKLMHGEFLQDLRKKGLSVELFEADGCALGSEIKIRGMEKKIISFVSLDYLGLGNWDPLKIIAAENVLNYGTGLASSRSMFDSYPHKELERELASFKRSPGTVLLNTGYQASGGVIKIIAFEMMALGKRMRNKPPSLIVMDELTHASIQEVLLPTRNKSEGFVRTQTYRHLDYDMAEEILVRHKDFPGQKFIISDSLFSMNGSFVDTTKLLDMAKKHRCIVILDGAHSDAVYGFQGRGILEMQGIKEEDRKYFVEAGTLSKAFAALGGYVAMPSEICELVPPSHWGYLFSVALPTHIVASVNSTLDVVMGEEGQRRRNTLHESTRYLLGELIRRGFQTLNSESHIIPVLIGSETTCIAVQRFLMERGILVGAVRFPATKKKKALLRISLTALNTANQIEKLLGELESARDLYRF